jgi:hypothetical protein
MAGKSLPLPADRYVTLTISSTSTFLIDHTLKVELPNRKQTLQRKTCQKRDSIASINAVCFTQFISTFGASTHIVQEFYEAYMSLICCGYDDLQT